MAAGAYLFSAFQNHQSQTVPNGSAAAPAMNNTAGGMNVSNPTNSASSASPADMSIPVVVNPALVSHQEVDQLNNEAGTPVQEARFMAQAAFQEWGSQSLDLLKVEAAKNWLESSAGRSEGVESAFAAADILGKLKSGKNDEAGAGAIDMAIGLIPLEGPGFGMAQAAHKIPGAVAQSAMVDFIGKINDFMGNDGSHEAAQAQYDEMMNQMTFGQKTIASFIGMKNEE